MDRWGYAMDIFFLPFCCSTSDRCAPHGHSDPALRKALKIPKLRDTQRSIPEGSGNAQKGCFLAITGSVLPGQLATFRGNHRWNLGGTTVLARSIWMSWVIGPLIWMPFTGHKGCRNEWVIEYDHCDSTVSSSELWSWTKISI
jgi:hypothetical protein